MFSKKPAAVPNCPSRKKVFSWSVNLSVHGAVSAGRSHYSKAQEEAWTIPSLQNAGDNSFLLGKKKDKGREISTEDGFIQEHLLVLYT